MGEPIEDGTTTFIGGQNAGLYPDRIGRAQYASGINGTTKDGTFSPRPGKTQIGLTFPQNTFFTRPDGTKISHEKIFNSGKFQCAGDYINDTGKFIIAVISGIIFQIDPVAETVVVLDIETQTSVSDIGIEAIEPRTQRLDQYTARIQWSHAGRFFVIFDYPDYPIIIEGGSVRRADPAKFEIFPSVLGAFNETRMFAFSNLNEFTAGDSTSNTLTPNAPITFEEVLAPAAPYATQIFSLGSTNSNNPITAVGFLQQTDNITGIGPMFVATKSSTYMYHTETPRAQWQNEQFGTLVLAKVGMASQRGVLNLNGDILFYDGMGNIRAFSVAQADQKRWSHTPIDKEVKNWVKYDDPTLTPACVAGYFNNRAFFSVNPFRANAIDLYGNKVIDYACKGMVALELDNVSGFGQGATPVWAGLWTGLKPMEMVDLDGTLYIFSKDSNSTNTLYRVESDDITWDTWQGKQKQIKSRLYTRDYNFAESVGPFVMKEEVAAYTDFKIIEGKFSCELEKKSDQYPVWEPWRIFSHIAQVQRSDFPFDKVMPELLPHSFREINMGSPIIENQCNLITSEELRYFNKMQLCLTITGLNWKLDNVRLKATTQEDANLITDVCPEDGLPKQLILDDDRLSDWDFYSTPFALVDEEVCL